MKVQQITNITIKDSIVQRSSLLFKEGENRINVFNSVVQRSDIGEKSKRS